MKDIVGKISARLFLLLIVLWISTALIKNNIYSMSIYGLSIVIVFIETIILHAIEFKYANRTINWYINIVLNILIVVLASLAALYTNLIVLPLVCIMLLSILNQIIFLRKKLGLEIFLYAFILHTLLTK
jgi:hypothetical protein